jgi:hypothetical protein
MRNRRSSVATTAAALFITVICVLLIFTGCGGDGAGSSEVESLIRKAEEAGEQVDSYHMVLTMYIESAETGSTITEELVLEISGDDAHMTDTIYNPETGESLGSEEVIRVGDRQYRKNIGSDQWVEDEEATLSEEAAGGYTAYIGEFLTNSISSENLGEEEVNGVTAVHLRFELSTENIKSLMTNVPASSLEGSPGGQVDVWLEKEENYPVRYELLFRGVILGQYVESADVRIIIDITAINQPVTITAPV